MRAFARLLLLAASGLVALLLCTEAVVRNPLDLAMGRAEAAPEEPSKWFLTLLGPGDRPLCGVPITVGGSRDAVRTNSRGTAVLSSPIAGEAPIVGHLYDSRWTRLEQQHTILRYPHLIPLEVEFRRAGTGKAIKAPNPRLVDDYGKRLALEGARMDLSPFAPGERTSCEIGYELPAGHTTAYGLRYVLDPRVSIAAARLKATVVVWPEVDLTVRVMDGDGNPIPGMELRWVLLGDEDQVSDGEIEASGLCTDGAGRTRIHGVPRIEGLGFRVMLSEAGYRACAETTVHGPSRALDLVAVEDENADAPFTRPSTHTAIGLGGGRGKADRGGALPVGALEGEAYRLDGQPAGRAMIMLDGCRRAWADERGRFRFDEVPKGEHKVWIAEPGLVPTCVVAEVNDLVPTSVVLREAEGWALRVRALDSRGKPLAYWPLEVRGKESGTGYAIVEAGTQIWPLLTGADGSRLIPNLGKEAVVVALAVRGVVLTEAEVAYPGEDGASVELRLAPPAQR